MIDSPQEAGIHAKTRSDTFGRVPKRGPNQPVIHSDVSEPTLRPEVCTYLVALLLFCNWLT